MSAPTPATGDGSPAAGYYPDPSIPGYIRYWNGAAWAPGTSRPAPEEGEPMPTPPTSAFPAATASAAAAAPAPAPVPAPAPPVDETGPVFLDDDPSISSESGPGAEAASGGAPEPASAWQADLTRQRGYDGAPEAPVSWGAAPGSAPDPRIPGAADPTGGALPGVRQTSPRPEPEPRAGEAAPAARPSQPTSPQPAQAAQSPLSPRTPQAAQSAQALQAPHVPAQPQPVGPPQPAAPQQASAAVPPQAGHAPVTSGHGGGAASWPQQVQQLAAGHQAAGEADRQPVAPWKPPVSDPFLQAAQERANARPAGLGRRLAARLIDGVVFGALAGAAATPFVLKGLGHMYDKLEAAKQSGETVTVWLVDATNAVQFGIALALMLVLGVLYEALPTARWGRTLGKKLCGIQVRDLESYEPPSFGGALRRWLVYGVLGLLAVGVLNVLWCLVDRPWRQCWHDKAAGTFVARG
ncbi:RDD family protein [Streptomyces sp. MUM 203J]|uniref:RDD family protein n=1 Tax=Streptomyces sp. MUM 203J TaxID=2791990 RepID=UPI001F04BA70|nr:RDD family protein [Streptomyces sp. MUM 203J]MCH0540503.1 RDD family protein [Streptomyces sp. MUM 203J]